MEMGERAVCLFVCLFVCTTELYLWKFENQFVVRQRDREQLLRVGSVQSSFWIPTQDHQTKPETKSTSPPPLPPQTTHQSCFPSESWLIKYTHTHTNQVFQKHRKTKLGISFFLWAHQLSTKENSSKNTHIQNTQNKAHHQTKLVSKTHTHTKPKLFVSVEAYCHSTKRVLQKTHTHTPTHKKENQNYVSRSLLLSLNQTQESFHFKSEIAKLCHICCTHLLPTQCTKKKAMHDEHIFLLLSHDLQNLAFVFSRHPNNLIKLSTSSLEE